MSDETSSKFDFDLGFQKKILGLYLRDGVFAAKVKDLLKPEYFVNDAHASLLAILQRFQKTFRALPDRSSFAELLRDEVAAKRLRKEQLVEVATLVGEIFSPAFTAEITNPGFVEAKVADFAKQRAIEEAMVASVGLLESGKVTRFSDIAEQMKKALAVGISQDGDRYDYFKEIDSRTTAREEIKAGKVIKTGISTGYTSIDAELYHMGWGRKELSCIMGPAKSGKSMSLGDFTKNASILGYNTLYVSLEVSKVIIANRLDAAISDTMMKDLNMNPMAVDAAVRKIGATSGALELRDAASGTFKPSHLQRMLERYRDEGIIFDLVTVDYADIMAAEYPTDRLQDNLRSIYIDLRALMHEWNVAGLTATQTNREGAKSLTGKATDVGDDFNKVRTVDILIGINATEAEVAAGEARLYWAASRNTRSGFTLKVKQNREKMQFINSVVGELGKKGVS